MNLTDALSELRDNLLHDDGLNKYWSDSTLTRYIGEAQNQFARKTLCLQDSVTTEATQITLVNAQAVYTLHPSVLQVRSARHQDAEQDLVRSTHAINFARLNVFTDTSGYLAQVYADVHFSVSADLSGQPRIFATDESIQLDDQHQIRMLFLPLPSTLQAGKVVFLRVARRPLAKPTLTAPNRQFEIPEDWHLDMLEWAAYRALRNWDGDAGEKGEVEEWNRAEDHKKRFLEAVNECKKEVQDKMLQPPTWKFGQAGFGGYPR